MTALWATINPLPANLSALSALLPRMPMPRVILLVVLVRSAALAIQRALLLVSTVPQDVTKMRNAKISVRIAPPAELLPFLRPLNVASANLVSMLTLPEENLAQGVLQDAISKSLVRRLALNVGRVLIPPLMVLLCAWIALLDALSTTRLLLSVIPVHREPRLLAKAYPNANCALQAKPHKPLAKSNATHVLVAPLVM